MMARLVIRRVFKMKEFLVLKCPGTIKLNLQTEDQIINTVLDSQIRISHLSRASINPALHNGGVSYPSG